MCVCRSAEKCGKKKVIWSDIIVLQRSQNRNPLRFVFTASWSDDNFNLGKLKWPPRSRIKMQSDSSWTHPCRPIRYAVNLWRGRRTNSYSNESNKPPKSLIWQKTSTNQPEEETIASGGKKRANVDICQIPARWLRRQTKPSTITYHMPTGDGEKKKVRFASVQRHPSTSRLCDTQMKVNPQSGMD